MYDPREFLQLEMFITYRQDSLACRWKHKFSRLLFEMMIANQYK